MTREDLEAELELAKAHAARIEAELSIIYHAIDVAKERYPTNNAFRAFHRIVSVAPKSSRYTEVAVRPTCNDAA